MGIFGRKGARYAYLPLHVLRWGEVRLLDPSLSQAEFNTGVTMAKAAGAVVEQNGDALLDRPDIDALLRHLIPTLLPLGGFPDNPDEVAIDFLVGWSVADAESAGGLNKQASISRSAALALSLLRQSPEGEEERAPATWRFMDLGYCCNRLNLGPQAASAAVLAS